MISGTRALASLLSREPTPAPRDAIASGTSLVLGPLRAGMAVEVVSGGDGTPSSPAEGPARAPAGTP
jgi:diacylglycerol kinase family enzyme